MATLSHELRTPLAAIKGYSTALLLEEVEWPDEKKREFLRLIDQECDHLQTMIGDILDSSLIDVDQMTLEIQPVRLQHLAREFADEMKHRVKIHRLVVDLPDNFPIVYADSFRIKQVIRNIVDNSIKYSPEGGLIVIRGEERPEDVVISISDQGVGISQEDLIPLFERFFRVKSPTGYHVAGTGLGLPVARTIVEKHKGRIWAESKIGEGTTLYFSLPINRSGLDD
jgi:two-component system phosphate regulon sensor histidine kinase PhoR